MAILYIEDEHFIADAVCEALTLCGRHFYYADSVKQALEILSQEAIDFIVADYNLLDGTLLDIYNCSEIDLSSIPAILISAADNKQTELLCQKANLVKTLAKPVKTEEILNALPGTPLELPRSYKPLGPISPDERSAFLDLFTDESENG